MLVRAGRPPDPTNPDEVIANEAAAAAYGWKAGQIVRLRIEDPELCLRLFKSNRDAGLLLFAGLLADAVMRAA